MPTASIYQVRQFFKTSGHPARIRGGSKCSEKETSGQQRNPSRRASSPRISPSSSGIMRRANLVERARTGANPLSTRSGIPDALRASRRGQGAFSTSSLADTRDPPRRAGIGLRVPLLTPRSIKFFLRTAAFKAALGGPAFPTSASHPLMNSGGAPSIRSGT